MRSNWIVLIAVAITSAIFGAASFAAYVAAMRPPDTPAIRPVGEMYIMTLDDKTVLRLNADSVLGARSARQGWIKSEIPAKDGKGASTRLELVKADCETTAFKVLSYTVYDDQGEASESWNENPKFPADTQYPIPDSVGEAMLKSLCDKRYDRPLAKKV